MQTKSSPPDEYALTNATSTDEIYQLAYCLAGWGLRNGMSEAEVVDWVTDQPREAALPRGSSGRLNPTRHHVESGAKAAVDNYDPNIGGASNWSPEPLHELAARVSGSGTRHERYLLGAIALCHKLQTNTPVITGPMLSEVVGVNEAAAGKVLRSWATNLADGFFTDVTYDGVRGHGRVWHIDVDWLPVGKLTHEPGCNRSKSRCQCRKTVYLSLTAAKDRYTKVRQTQAWLDSLKWQQPVTATDACKALGLTRAAAAKLLESEQGRTFCANPSEAGTRRTARGGLIRTPKTWHVADRWQRWENGSPPAVENNN